MIAIYCISIDLHALLNKRKISGKKKIEAHYFLRVGTSFSTFFFNTIQISYVRRTLLSRLSSTSEKKSIVDIISSTNSFSSFYFIYDSKDFLSLFIFTFYFYSLSFFKQLLRAYFFSPSSFFLFISSLS